MTAKHVGPRTLFAGTIASLTIVAAAWLAYSYPHGDAAASAAPAALPEVVVSRPLLREVDSTLGFLGQFSAVEQVELRAQVGGTLTEIHFRDGDIVQKGDLLFAIDPRPYEIRLAQANAQLETATARLELADRELVRAQARLKRAERERDAALAENAKLRQRLERRSARHGKRGADAAAETR